MVISSFLFFIFNVCKYSFRVLYLLVKNSIVLSIIFIFDASIKFRYVLISKLIAFILLFTITSSFIIEFILSFIAHLLLLLKNIILFISFKAFHFINSLSL